MKPSKNLKRNTNNTMLTQLKHSGRGLMDILESTTGIPASSISPAVDRKFRLDLSKPCKSPPNVRITRTSNPSTPQKIQRILFLDSKGCPCPPAITEISSLSVETWRIPRRNLRQHSQDPPQSI